MNNPHVWLRAETKAKERRTALTPTGAAKLLEAGFRVTVEDDPLRIFPIADYASVGCDTGEAGDWRTAPPDAFILGLKELEASDEPLVHRHIHFAHVFKDQAGSAAMLSRFRRGGGSLFDLEYLVDADGRRVAAFGYWAGFCGAALGMMAFGNQRIGKRPPLAPVNVFMKKDDLVATVEQTLAQAEQTPTAMVIGAKGRSGRGAVELITTLGLNVIEWDMEETAAGGPFSEINDVDVLINCVFVNSPLPPFVTLDSLNKSRRLSVITDVSCDPYGTYNPLPIYSKTTNFDAPTVAIEAGSKPLDLIAIDHLPSMLPRESSEDYGSQLLGSLLALDKPDSGVWGRARAVYSEKSQDLRNPHPDA